ncbi:PCDA3 protein, partial [Certhia familiaris]|nr:PCDA3 protein [Certhia familiaris]
IAESSVPGSRFPLEGATDADIGTNAQLSYTLSPSEHFRIEEENSNSRSKSLFLVLAKPLDRETIPVHRLVLTASDGGRPSLTGTMELVISVLDANDNAPQFNQSVYNAHLPEDAIQGTVVARINATDLDEGSNRDVKYEIDTVVSGASGALLVSSRLDREELCGKSAPCALRLEVLLERPLRVFHVELEVTDINDNAPVFPAARKNLSIAESSVPGSRFPLEGATDADIGTNAQLSYTLSPSEHFRIEEENSNSRSKSLFLVLAKPLDRETIPVHRLVLTASDGGRPSLTGTMELVISVLDANDNAPQFNQSVYNAHLPEDAIQGTVVARINATDLDEGSNRDVKYE